MAVHAAMPGLSVTISIDGTAAPEFGSPSDLPNIYRCYINRRAGANSSYDVSLDTRFVWAENALANQKRGEGRLG
ncbi:Uncharacterized protein HZ326_27805 [Fusarium oxysporum f. sp. albedinis]|nr:Uncharacterized protein HZ326_27805 [Fusarium oxysporum f. sp. albedinis]